MADRATATHHVVIIGAGFGGLSTARHLADAGVRITIVEANNFHTFQPLLYQVATAGLAGDDVAHPVRPIFRDRRDVDVVMAEVVDIDTAGRTITLDHGGSVGYDTLVVACGAVSASFGVDGVDEHAFPLKDLDGALAMRDHLLTLFEDAHVDAGLVADGALDVVVSGGGPTGVEVAGGLAELYRLVLAADFPTLPVEDARIVLVEPQARLLSSFSEPSSAQAKRRLEQLGVEVRLGVGVERVTARRVRLTDGTEIPAHTTVWAAGVRANPLANALGAATGPGGRAEVAADLSGRGLADVFAIGDIAFVPDDDGRALPQVAQPAIQAGRHVARQVRRRLAGEPTEPFRYVDKGSMATIGRRDAVTELPNGWRLSGTVGWLAWLGLHLLYLMGFRNRVAVFFSWCWNYLTYDRASRLLSARRRRDDRLTGG